MHEEKKILLLYGPRLDGFDNAPKFLTKTFLFEIESHVEYENTILIGEDFSVPVFDFLQKYSLGEFETEILVVDNVVDILKTWKSVSKEVFKIIPPIYSRIVKGVIFMIFPKKLELLNFI